MKESIKKTLIIALLNPISLMFALLFYLVLGNTETALSLPPFSSFIHVRPDHFIINMVFCFLLLSSRVNSYSIKQIIIIASIISILYFPLQSFLGLQNAIGISGFLYFLASRHIFTRETKKPLWYSLGVFLAIAEFATIKNPDGYAHGVHLIGYFMGIISITIPLSENTPKWARSIFHPLG